MILVTFAVPFESAEFRRRAVSRSVRIVHTGVGAENARGALERALCAGPAPERVVVAGFAGALVLDLAIGEIIDDATRLVSAEAVLATVEAKRVFREETGAEAVDMETDVIREVCRVAGLPVTVRRAISDGAEDDLGLPPGLLDRLAAQPVVAGPELLWTLLTQGERRRAFLRLVRDCRTAQRALADALEREIR